MEDDEDGFDEESEFECLECGEELGETGACTNEDCCEYDSEEDPYDDQGGEA